MKIKIVAVGKIKEEYLNLGIKEYTKRISKYANVEIIECKDEKIPENPTLKEIDKIKELEGEKILSKIKSDEHVIILDLNGLMITSIDMAKEFTKIMVNGKNTITFVIGGSLGLGENVVKRADFKIAFGKITYPHQLIRLVLCEQVYRSFKINNNETYHK